MAISFHCEDISFTLKKKAAIRSWINSVSNSYGKKIGSINYIFCSDRKILEINKSFLNHNYYTDIISFDYTNSDKSISGDIFISIDMVLHNSQKFDSPFNHELMRVMIHGILHFLGLKDKTKEDSKKMRNAENSAIRAIL